MSDRPEPRPPDTGRQLPRHGRPLPEPLEMSQERPAAPAEEGIANGGGEKPRNRWPLAFVLLALAAMIIFLRFQVLTISSLRVIGTRDVALQSVAQAIGLERGLFYFMVDEDDIRQRVNAHRYLVYEGMEKIFPNTLVLHVRERRPYAFFTHLGIGFVLADDGMILEMSRDLTQGAGKVIVSGLSVWGQLSPGSPPQSTDPEQVEMLVKLFSALYAWGFENQVKSISIANSLNMSLSTTDGYLVNLGGMNNLYAKIGTVQSVVSELRRRQMFGGTIEAVVPGEATYRAPGL
jgi:cell division septal protein FtsQ